MPATDRPADGVFAEHREIDIVVQLDASAESIPQVLRHIQVLETTDVWNLRDALRARLHDPGYADDDGVHSVSRTALHANQTIGGRDELLGDVQSAARIGRLDELMKQSPAGIA